MKKLLLTFLIVAMAKFVVAQGYGLDWVQDLRGNQTVQVTTVTTEANGDIIASGNFSDSVDLDPGPAVAMFGVASGTGSFVVKLDANGGYKWGKVYGGNASVNTLREHAVDQYGGIYLGGRFDNTVDFDPGPGIVNRTATSIYDAYLLKLDINGNFEWVMTYHNTGICEVLGITVDDFNHVTITGDFSDTVDFEPGPGVTNLISGGLDDAFIARYHSNGTLKWAKSCPGSGLQASQSIDADSDGDLFITGQFIGTVDFDPGPLTFNLTASTSGSTFVLQLDSSGLFRWAIMISGINVNFAKCVRVNNAGDVYVAGSFGGTADFDPSAGITNKTAMGGIDGYLLKLDNGLLFQWVQTVPGIKNELPEHLAIDQSGNVLMTGDFNGLVDFDPGPDTTAFLPGVTGYDMFLSKYSGTNGDFIWAHAQGASGANIGAYSYVTVDQNNRLYVGRNFLGSADFSPGATKHILNSGSGSNGFVQRLLPCSNTTDTLRLSACNSFTWIDSITYTADDTATFVLVNQAGCDSIITLLLTVNYSDTGVDSITSCEGITWIDGKYYDESTNQPTFIVPNSNGCDSIVQLAFTKIYVDTLLVIRDFSLEVYRVSDSYQWLDCDDNYKAMPGRTANSIIPDRSGRYACEVTYKGCVDTTRCVYMKVVGISTSELNNLRLYPNPARNQLYLDFGQTLSKGMVILRNNTGQLIQAQELDNQASTTMNISDLPNGIYTVEISTEDERIFRRVVKN